MQRMTSFLFPLTTINTHFTWSFSASIWFKQSKHVLNHWMSTVATKNKKAVLSQRWPHNAPYTWVPWKCSGLPDYAHGYYSQHFSWAFVPIDLWMFLLNLKSVALPVPEIIGGTPKKFRQSLNTPTLPFLQNF